MSQPFNPNESPYPQDYPYADDDDGYTGDNERRRSANRLSTSEDDEDDYNEFAPYVKAVPIATTYERCRHRHVRTEAPLAERALSVGMNVAEDAAGAVVAAVGGFLGNVVSGARKLWNAHGPEARPLLRREVRPVVRTYKTAEGPFHVVTVAQGRGLVQRDTAPTGTVSPFAVRRSRSSTTTGPGWVPTMDAADDAVFSKRPQNRPRHAWKGAGGLIEVSSDDDNYMEVDMSAPCQIAVKKVVASQAGKQSVSNPASDSETESYADPESADSDFDKDGGVAWPLSKENKRKHMEKVTARREAEAKRQGEEERRVRPTKEKRRKEENKRERQAKTLITRMKAEEVEEHIKKQIADWPPQLDAMASAVPLSERAPEPVAGEEIFDPATRRYCSPSQYLRENERQLLELKEQRRRDSASASTPDKGKLDVMVDTAPLSEAPPEQLANNGEIFDSVPKRYFSPSQYLIEKKMQRLRGGKS